MNKAELDIPTGTHTLIFSKLYYGILTQNLEKLDIDRYFAVIMFLSSNKICCQQQICDNLLVDKTAMVKVLDYLSKIGYIERKINPKDRREHYIVLSKKGEKQVKEVIKAVQTLEQKTFSSVSKHDEIIFKNVLASVTNNLKESPFKKSSFDYNNAKRKIKSGKSV